MPITEERIAEMIKAAITPKKATADIDEKNLSPEMKAALIKDYEDEKKLAEYNATNKENKEYRDKYLKMRQEQVDRENKIVTAKKEKEEWAKKNEEVMKTIKWGVN